MAKGRGEEGGRENFFLRLARGKCGEKKTILTHSPSIEYRFRYIKVKSAI